MFLLSKDGWRCINPFIRYSIDNMVYTYYLVGFDVDETSFRFKVVKAFVLNISMDTIKKANHSQAEIC